MTKTETEAIKKNLFEFYNGHPPVEVLAHDLEVSTEEAQAILDSFSKSLPLQKEEREDPRMTVIKESVRGRKRKGVEMSSSPRDYPLRVISAVMGIIGLGAAVISSYYVFLRLQDILPLLLALGLSGFLVLFATFAPQVGLLLLRPVPRVSVGRPRKGEKRQRFPGVLSKISSLGILSLLWLIVLIVNISSSIAGQYSSWLQATKTELSSHQESSSSQERLVLKQEERSTLQKSLESYQEERKPLVQQQTFFDTEEKKQENLKSWNSLQYLLGVNKKAILDTENKISVLNKEIEILLRENPEVVLEGERESLLDFYSWASTATGISRESLHFYYLAFLAVFVEIIAPVGVAVFLFLREPVQNRKPSL